MLIAHTQIAPPKSWETFEDLCHALFKAEWRDSNTQINGLHGQKQNGVDVFGKNLQQDGDWWCVQCKRKRIAIDSRLTQKEVDDELAASSKFKPQLHCLIIATTSPYFSDPQGHLASLRQQLQSRGNSALQPYAQEEIQVKEANKIAKASRVNRKKPVLKVIGQ